MQLLNDISSLFNLRGRIKESGEAGERERRREGCREGERDGEHGDGWTSGGRERRSKLATGSVSTWGIMTLEQGSSTSPC